MGVPAHRDSPEWGFRKNHVPSTCRAYPKSRTSGIQGRVRLQARKFSSYRVGSTSCRACTLVTVRSGYPEEPEPPLASVPTSHTALGRFYEYRPKSSNAQLSTREWPCCEGSSLSSKGSGARVP